MPDFKEVGFLGDELSQFGANVRAAYAPAFGLADTVNKLAMRLLWALPLDSLDEPKAYAVTCFARAVESYQCAILMCERGAVVEARTLMRTMAETVFLAYAFKRKQGMVDLLVEDSARHRKGYANEMIVVGQRRGLDVTQYEQELAKIGAKYPNGPRSIKWASLSNEVGLHTLYQLAYRQTSGDAAHATLDALNRHVKVDAQGHLESFDFNPSHNDVDATLKGAMAGMVHLFVLAVADMGMKDFEPDVQNVLLEWRVYLAPNA